MSKVLRRRWRSEVASGLPRRDRASCDYETYLPDLLVGRDVRLDGSTPRPPPWQTPKRWPGFSCGPNRLRRRESRASRWVGVGSCVPRPQNHLESPRTT
jgi:hypothetical protein